LTNDGQPEAGSGHATRRRRSVEPLEDVWHVFGGNAWTVIDHRHLASPHIHVDVATHGTPFDCVVDEVADGAIDGSRIDVHQTRLQGRVHRHPR
jgi:hypothetical protein